MGARDKFCNKCGQGVFRTGVYTNNTETLPSKCLSPKELIFAIITIGIVLGIAGVFVSDNKGYKKPFDYLENGVNNCDVDAFSCFFSTMLDEDYVPTHEELLDQFGRYGTKIHFDIIDAEKLTDEKLEWYH